MLRQLSQTRKTRGMGHKLEYIITHISIKIIHGLTMHSCRSLWFGKTVIMDGSCIDLFLDFLEIMRDIVDPDVSVGVEVEGGFVGAGSEDTAGFRLVAFGVVTGSHIYTTALRIGKGTGPVQVAEGLEGFLAEVGVDIVEELDD